MHSYWSDSDPIYLHIHDFGTVNKPHLLALWIKFLAWRFSLLYIAILPQVNDFLGTQGLKDLIYSLQKLYVDIYLYMWIYCTRHTRRKSNFAITPTLTCLHYSKLDLLASSMQALWGGYYSYFKSCSISSIWKNIKPL